jgi:predicted RND superfamily exporter protein
MDAFARWLVSHPVPVVVVTLVATLLLGARAVHIRFENALDSMLPAGDPAVAYYERTRTLFGSDDVAVVGVIADDLFAPQTIEKLAHVTDALAKIEGVERVLSIANAVDPAADVLHPPRLLPHIPPTPGEVEALRKKLASTPLYGKNMISDDGKGAAINVFFRPLTDAEYVDFQIDDHIRQILRTAGGPERFFYTGAAHVKQAAVELMRQDLFHFTPLAIGLVVVALWLAFRTRRGVVLPLASVVIAVVWTLGIMVLAGKGITIGTFVLPPLLLVVGASYAIHVMARYYEQAAIGGDRKDVVVRGFQRVWMPLAISAVVTVIGFGSLMVNRIPAIFELGLFAVVGIVCLTITSLTFLPAVLALLALPAAAARGQAAVSPLVPLLGWIARLVYEERRAILAGAVMVGAVALVGARFIHVDSDFLSYFSPRAEVRRANETINHEIVGSNPFYVVIEAREPGALRRWEVLKHVRDLQQYLATLPGVTSSLSLVDYLELLETGLNAGGEGDFIVDPQGNIVPAAKPATFWEEPKNLEPVLKMIDASPATFKGVVTADFGKASILVRTNLSGSRAIEKTLADIREYVAGHFPADLPVQLTGNLVLLTGTTSDIVAGQIESLGIALGVIFAVMALMFLSVRIGFLAIVPNLLPIIIFFGVMGWLGILLNLGTSLIATIALGIAVDSTIHYMARLNLELQGETDQAAAISRTLRTVGVPIVYTTVALFFGFLTFALSSFVPIQSFGVLSGVTMATALGANLVLLPTVLATAKIITVWDLVGVKLGKDPASTIPLFAGLRPTQARVVCLMGQLRRYEAGQAIVRVGERGDAMFVIIQGECEVWVGDSAHRQRIRELRRGEVFGEMGLVRQNERSADVVATSPVEALELDERFLERIRRRYPRIAAQVLLNLTRLLSDSLDRTTQRLIDASSA